MNRLLLIALAIPLICLALLSSLGFLGVLTLGLLLHVVGTLIARLPRWLSSSAPTCAELDYVAELHFPEWRREGIEPGGESALIARKTVYAHDEFGARPRCRSQRAELIVPGPPVHRYPHW